jgi:oxygen-independent coproporphyrinogen-3 oxidase
LIAGGTKYHAHFVPDDDVTAEMYDTACDRLNAAGIQQYEISNFSREGYESRHNLKYWTRQPYLGFGVDAHSMLPASAAARTNGIESVRLATTDNYDQFLISAETTANEVTASQALEEAFFLGLRLNRGIDLKQFRSEFGEQKIEGYKATIEELVFSGLLRQSGSNLQLTPRGRLLSNEVFERFISAERTQGPSALLPPQSRKNRALGEPGFARR